MKIGEFARENGVSLRTLRYYDEMGVLHPAAVNAENGYREYSPEDAQRLQAIRFYQLVGFRLDEIRRLLDVDGPEHTAALSARREALVHQRDRLNRLIALLEPSPQQQEALSLTALLSAYARAFHANAATRGFRDVHARRLLTDEEWDRIRGHLLAGRAYLLPGGKGLTEDEALEAIVRTQLLPATLARSILCEEALVREAAAGTRQAVLLGAGLDALALRHPRMRVYEVDRPAMVADKRARLQRAGLPSEAVCVPADLLLDDLPARLREAGFDRSRKALFTLLGVSWYLSAGALDALLAEVAALSAKGTALLLDYADEGFMGADVPRVRRMIAMAEAAGEPVRTCLSQGALAAMLERHGFAIYEHVSWREMKERCFAEAPGVEPFEHISCALAVFTG